MRLWLVLGLDQILGVIHGVHRLALLPCLLLLHWGRMMGLGLVSGGRRISLTLLASSWT